MEENVDFFQAEIEEGGCIARDPLLDAGVTCSGRAFWPQAFAAFADAKRQPVRRCMVMVMAGAAGNVAVARQDGIIKQQLSDPCQLRIKRVKVRFTQGRRKRLRLFSCGRGGNDQACLRQQACQYQPYPGRSKGRAHRSLPQQTVALICRPLIVCGMHQTKVMQRPLRV